LQAETRRSFTSNNPKERDMTSEIVAAGKAAWTRLKNGSKSWGDWVQVGHALLEGRAIAMRNAGVSSPIGGGYTTAFSDWLFRNRFDIGPSHRARLLVVMNLLPEIERWRATLTPLQRARMIHPGAVLKNYRRATSIKPPLEHVSPDVLAEPAP
jgi:hypothetical protein